MYYLASFNWTGDYTKTLKFSLLKTTYEKMFTKLYKKACDAINPCIETWNKEFNLLYPDRKNNINELDPLYERYIRSEIIEVLSTLDNKVFKLFLNDEMQICGKLNDYDAKVFITLVPPTDK